jgi:hypothetical protein
VHVGGQVGETVVVLLDVLLEHVVGAVHVQRVFLEAVQELVGAEVCRRLVWIFFMFDV